MTQQPQTDGVKSALTAAERFEQQHYETGPDGSAKELQACSLSALLLRMHAFSRIAQHENDCVKNRRLTTSRPP